MLGPKKFRKATNTSDQQELIFEMFGPGKFIDNIL